MKRALRIRLHVLVAMLLVVPFLTLAQPQAAQASSCPCGMFASAIPSVPDTGPDTPNKFGMAFHADTYGWVTGMRFYKAAGNTGTHIGQFYANDDTGYFELNQVTFTGETASGWQTAMFAHPTYLMPGYQYIVSYTASNGHWSYDPNYFAAPVSNGPLHTNANAGRYHNTDLLGDSPATVTDSSFAVDVVFETYQNESSLFGGTTATPAIPVDVNNGQKGTRFYSDLNSPVIGVRFWANSAWYHPFTAYLYSSTGAVLATQDLGNSDVTQGWWEIYFTTPVQITAGTEYVAAIKQDDPSVTAFGWTPNYFSSPYTNGSFHAPANAGVYSTNQATFPSTQTDSNFWIEPVFANEASNTVSATIDPSFTFSVANRATACNGESNFVSGAGSASAVALGHLAAAANVSGGQALAVVGNAGGGFAVYVRGSQSSQNLRSTGHNWTDVAGTYASPAVLGAGERFGYTYADSTSSSSVTNPSSANFAALDATNHPVMGSTTSRTGSGCVSFDAQSSASTPAAAYSATIIYTAVPSF